MSTPRIVTVAVNIAITETVDQAIELNSVLGQNIPQYVLALLRQDRPGWQRLEDQVYSYLVPGSSLSIQVDGRQSPVMHVRIVGGTNQKIRVPPGQEQAARQRAAQALKTEIQVHRVECNRVFNELVNDAIKEAIFQFAQSQGQVESSGWKSVPVHQENARVPQVSQLRVRIPA